MEDQRPIIVKRVKKRGGHHGGAWKVAFADFATAMMAFFLVLWLDASTSEEQKAAIQGYFVDPSGFASGASDSAIDLGGSPSVTVVSHAQDHNPDQAPEQTKPQIKIEDKQIEKLAENIVEQRLQDLKKEIEDKINETETLQQFKDQIKLDITKEGLRIQIVDQSKRPMFDSGSSELKHYSEDILFELAKSMAEVPNKISIEGHTDAEPFLGREGYTNWELSSDRANAARRALVEGGIDDSKVARVVGLGSSVLYDEFDPLNAVNRRISIIVLNKSVSEEIERNAGAVQPPAVTDEQIFGEPPINVGIEPPIDISADAPLGFGQPVTGEPPISLGPDNPVQSPETPATGEPATGEPSTDEIGTFDSPIVMDQPQSQPESGQKTQPDSPQAPANNQNSDWFGEDNKDSGNQNGEVVW